MPAHVNTVQGGSPLWQSVGTGIEYREFFLREPNHVYVARMERSNPQVTLDSSIAQGSLSGGLETVRDMARRYDQAINYWGKEWGARNQVVVAINGYFYDPKTGIPWSGQVQSGWYAKRFDDRQSRSGLAWTLDRNIFLGECITHPKAKQVVTFLASDKTQTFDNINVPRGEDELIIYTPQYDARTLTDDKGIEVQVELSRPMLILPAPAMITGTIRLIRDGQGNTPIPFDNIILSASGKAMEKLRSSAVVGELIGISQEIKQYESDCRTPLALDWSQTYASIGGSYYFLKDGVIQALGDLGAVLRSPRTAIAYNDQYVFFLVVDGRDAWRSLGMSMVELAVFAKNMLGATWGVAQDGGGSTTMVVNGEVKNHPNAELDETGAPASGTSPPVERAVANGMMMVVVVPKEQSSRFQPGERVGAQGTADIQVRLGPGTNYAVSDIVPAGSEGVIIDDPDRINGVLAKGEYWWKVAFGNIIGWVSENSLMLKPS